MASALLYPFWIIFFRHHHPFGGWLLIVNLSKIKRFCCGAKKHAAWTEIWFPYGVPFFEYTKHTMPILQYRHSKPNLSWVRGECQATWAMYSDLALNTVSSPSRNFFQWLKKHCFFVRSAPSLQQRSCAGLSPGFLRRKRGHKIHPYRNLFEV